MDKFNVRQGLPILEDNSNLHIGLAPPNALVIEEPPQFLAELLSFASTPRSRADLTDALTSAGVSRDDADQTVAELVDAGILSTRWVDRESRYSRHDLYFDLLYPEIAQPSQKLSRASVALIGVGGIGTNLAMQLSAAGVGRLVLVDADTVELSNLTRQFLFDEADQNESKVVAAKRHLRAKNQCVQIDEICSGVGGVADLRGIFADVDVVIISADTPQTIHQWANVAGLETGTPFSMAGYQDTRGLVGPFITPGTGPCLACAAASDGLAANMTTATGMVASISNLNHSYQAPSFGPLNGAVASFQAADVLRYLLGSVPLTASRRLVIDSATFENSFEEYERNGDCRACSAAS
jgi:molybdopterin/thiamine biosynthesis adenylyltransferase